MYVVAPLVVFLLLGVILLLYEPRISWRRLILSASVLWGVLLTAITELLSAFTALTSGWLFIYWVLVALALAVGIPFILRWRRDTRAILSWRLADMGKHGASALRRPSFALALPIIAVFAIAIVTGLLALDTAPNSADALNNSLARVMLWIQHGSVAPYPTAVLGQLSAPPWASFCAAQLYLLSGSDAFTQAIQWWSMLGSVLGVSLIARQLGASPIGQLGAAIFLATAPMSILQASSAQSVYVGTFWLVCFVHFALAFRARPQSFWNVLGLGASLGLALLTSATAAIIAAPLLLLICYWALRRLRWGVWEPVLIGGSAAFVLNAGYLSRNISAFGALLGPSAALGSALTTHFDFRDLSANLGAAIALQFATPPSHAGADWAPWTLSTHALSPDYAANPLHALLLFGVALAFLVSSRLRAERAALAYGGALALSFLTLALVLKWSLTNVQQEAPYLALGAPLVGLALSRLPLLQRETVARAALAIGALALLLALLPWLLANPSHPLIGPSSVFTTPRAAQYFADQPDPQAQAAAYAGAAAYLERNQCATLGLMNAPADSAMTRDYLWWVVMPSTLSTGARLYIEHVNVSGPSADLADQRPYSVFAPCAILLTTSTAPPSFVTYQGAIYRLAWQSTPMAVYTPQ